MSEEVTYYYGGRGAASAVPTIVNTLCDVTVQPLNTPSIYSCCTDGDRDDDVIDNDSSDGGRSLNPPSRHSKHSCRFISILLTPFGNK